MSTPSDDGAGTSVTCARCGTVSDGVPLTWSTSAERGRTLYYCDVCSRENLRSIEGRLDEQWWA
jgi:transposase